jgi:FemAB-related protein (PEP-CTERM system-associated)
MIETVLYDGSSVEWDDFVLNQPGAHIEHLFAWREIIEEAYRHRSYYLCSRDEGMLTGVLPLFRVKSHLFGDHLISMPFLDYGGILTVDKMSLECLHTAALKLARELGVKDLIYRHVDPSGLNVSAFRGKVTLIKELADTTDELWRALPSERRNRVRKTKKLGLSTRFAGKDELRKFYAIWSANMRDLGSPVHSKKFFELIFDKLGRSARLIFVENDQGRPVASGLTLTFSKTVLLPWVSSRREYFKLYPNNILYWDLMANSVEKGFRFFDFGRSSIDSGTYQFKKRWKADVTLLNWEYVSMSGDEVHFLNQQDESYNTLMSLWKKSPITVTNLIGPKLRRGLIN